MIYNLLLTEGDLRRILADIERRRAATGKPHCLQVHIEADCGITVSSTTEELSAAMITEMRAKGDLDDLHEGKP